MSNNQNSKTSSYSSYKKMKKQIKVSSKSELKKLENAQKIKKTLSIVIPVIIVLVVATIIAVNIMKDYGVFIRSHTVMESEHFKVDGAMMTYLFWDTVNTELVGDNASFYKMYNLTSVYDIDNKSHVDKTWREYFLEMTTETMQQMLTYAHYSISLGKTLSDEDNALIEEELIKIEAGADIYGLSLDKYLKTYYGRGVNMEDIRNTLEIIYLSSYGIDMVKENIYVTDAELDQYYESNINEIKRADYLFYVTGISGKDNLTEEQKNFYSARAQYIYTASNEEEFISRVTDYIKEVNDKLPENDPEKLNAEQLEEYIESELAGMKYEAVAYNEKSSSLDNWIFSSDRQVGDKYLNHTDGFGTYGIVYMLKPAYIPENWKEIAEKSILNQKEEDLLKSIDSKYVIKVNSSDFNVAEVQ